VIADFGAVNVAELADVVTAGANICSPSVLFPFSGRQTASVGCRVVRSLTSEMAVWSWSCPWYRLPSEGIPNVSGTKKPG
jgi:hypothetical protein